jgi:hypothetical protein
MDSDAGVTVCVLLGGVLVSPPSMNGHIFEMRLDEAHREQVRLEALCHSMKYAG